MHTCNIIMCWLHYHQPVVYRKVYKVASVLITNNYAVEVWRGEYQGTRIAMRRLHCSEEMLATSAPKILEVATHLRYIIIIYMQLYTV